MTTAYGFNYNGYALDCDPLKTSDGRFGAQIDLAEVHEPLSAVAHSVLAAFNALSPIEP